MFALTVVRTILLRRHPHWRNAKAKVPDPLTIRSTLVALSRGSVQPFRDPQKRTPSLTPAWPVTVIWPNRMRHKRKPKIGDPRSVSLTKLAVAEQHIRTAVRLFFEDKDPASIYLLGASAREITQSIGDKLSIKTVLTELAEERGIDRAELISSIHRFAGFMKHADRKPKSKIDLPYSDVEKVLQVACHDFARVAGGMPIEAQVYEAWISAIAFPKISEAPLKRQPLLRKLIAHFSGIRSADPAQRRKIGLAAMEKALQDPSLKMKIRHEI